MQNTGIYVVKLNTNNTHSTFQIVLFIFGCAKVKKKQVKVITSLLNRQILAFLIVVRKHKWHFWNLETKLDKVGMCVKESFEF